MSVDPLSLGPNLQPFLGPGERGQFPTPVAGSATSLPHGIVPVASVQWKVLSVFGIQII